jgi:hypothetical protein
VTPQTFIARIEGKRSTFDDFTHANLMAHLVELANDGARAASVRPQTPWSLEPPADADDDPVTWTATCLAVPE